MNRVNQFILLMVTKLFFGFNSYGMDGKITRTIKTINSVDTFHNNGNGIFNLVSQYAEIQDVSEGEGVFKKFSKTKHGISEDVIGVDIKGHYNLSIRENKFTKSEEDCLINVNYKIIEQKTTISFKYTVHAKFIDGNWQKYYAGEPIKIALTKEAIKIVKEKMIYAMKKGLYNRLKKAIDCNSIKINIKLGMENMILEGTINRLSISFLNSFTDIIIVHVYGL